MLDIQTYPNFLNKEEHEYVISKTINGGEWSFIGHSVNEGYKFWYMELINDEFFTNYFFDKIQKITNTKFELDRVYANGQTYGLPGSYHTDRSEEHTSELQSH